VKAKEAPWLKVIWVSSKARLGYFNPEENSFLNACVLLRSCCNVFKNLKTHDPLLSLTFLMDEQKLSLEEFVDGVYHPS
jgi:hypothetical protein